MFVVSFSLRGGARVHSEESTEGRVAELFIQEKGRRGGGCWLLFTLCVPFCLLFVSAFPRRPPCLREGVLMSFFRFLSSTFFHSQLQL